MNPKEIIDTIYNVSSLYSGKFDNFCKAFIEMMRIYMGDKGSVCLQTNNKDKQRCQSDVPSPDRLSVLSALADRMAEIMQFFNSERLILWPPHVFLFISSPPPPFMIYNGTLWNRLQEITTKLDKLDSYSRRNNLNNFWCYSVILENLQRRFDRVVSLLNEPSTVMYDSKCANVCANE